MKYGIRDLFENNQACAFNCSTTGLNYPSDNFFYKINCAFEVLVILRNEITNNWF